MRIVISRLSVATIDFAISSNVSSSNKGERFELYVCASVKRVNNTSTIVFFVEYDAVMIPNAVCILNFVTLRRWKKKLV